MDGWAKGIRLGARRGENRQHPMADIGVSAQGEWRLAAADQGGGPQGGGACRGRCGDRDDQSLGGAASALASRACALRLRRLARSALARRRSRSMSAGEGVLVTN